MSILKILKKKEETVEEEFNEINLLSPKIFPKEEAKEKFEYYFRKLRSAIYSKQAMNIAITGSYGSGKTTFIKNFQNVYSERKYLNISLATFKEEIDIPKDGADKLKNLERQIELSILQQILYHVKPSEIPNSNLKRIKSINTENAIIIAFGILTWLISVVILFKFKNFYKLNPYSWDLNLSFDWFISIISIIFFSGGSYLIYWLLKTLNSVNINKLKIFSSELELGKDVNKSILNEHIDEIIYFFQQTDFDVVIFEDIDRFENTEIFTKLREINLLLNKSKLIQRKQIKKIVFIYAIRDDKFKDNERTKFFDYIIPIIPFINPENANTQLWKLIKSEKLENSFSKDFINDITKLIDEIDMRLLINIFNEFITYKSQTLNNDFSHDVNNNLLAIIIYKNLYPNDFSSLSKREGELYSILNKKNEYLNGFIEVVNQQISTTETKIENLEKEKIQNIEELKAIYINKLSRENNNLIAIQIGPSYIPLSSLNIDDYFEKLKTITSFNYYWFNTTNHGFNRSNTQFSFNSLQNKVNSNLSYDERAINIKNGIASEIERYKQQIQNLKKQKTSIQNWDLSKIFQETEVVITFDKLKNSELLKYLLINGYINENYKYYTSLFHEENLTNKDRDFEIKAKTNQRTNFNYELTNVENLIDEIENKYFERTSILNYQILDYLIGNPIKERVKLKKFISQLAQDKSLYLDFVDSYIIHEESKHSESRNIDSFINLLCEKWHTIWNFIESESNYPIEKKNKYLKYIIQYANHSDIKLISSKSNFKKYIEENHELLNLFNESQYYKVANEIKGLNIKINNLTPLNKNNKILFDLVYKNNNYQINTKNIKLIIASYHIDEKIRTDIYKINHNFDKTNYQFILDSECKELISYLDKNFEYYIENVYLVTSINQESEDILLDFFINITDINENLIQDIIYKTETVFEDISRIQNNYFKQIIFEINKIKPTWLNIFEYLLNVDPEETTYINKTLIKFYNDEKNYKILSKSKMRPDNEKERLKDFYDNVEYSLLECREITDKAYTTLLNSSYYNYNSLGFENLNEEKVKMLLNIKKLNLTASNYDKLKAHFPNQHIILIEQNEDKFIKNFKDYHLDNIDYLSLLNSESLVTLTKLKLIPKIELSNFEDNKLSNCVAKIIIDNKSHILSFENLEKIIDNNTNMEKVINLVNLYIEKLEIHNLIELIDLMPYSYSSIITKKQTKIDNTNYNEIFINNLKSKGIVGKSEPKDGKIRLWMKKFKI